jgi:hypothetical protein
MRRKQDDLVRVDVPQDHPGLAEAEKRVRAFIRRYSMMAQFGNFDLAALARDCYLQGVWDGIHVAVMRPEVRQIVDVEPTQS